MQKTGWGKSAVYFIATALLREARLGPALLVSPLISLMRNQLAAAARMGVRAATIHSDNQAEWKDIETRLLGDAIDILLVSPERLANEAFAGGPLAAIAGKISLLVVDEAHCISDWGHDFRPHYRHVDRLLRVLPRNVRVLATTATANDRVLADLQFVLGPNLVLSRGDLERSSLTLQTIQMPEQAERLAWLAQTIPRLLGSGIVYTLTVRDANLVATWLRSRGISAEAYTSKSDHREPLEDALLANQVKALVATPALGMGFDKPDLAFVIHFQSPSSVVSYYQQVGRAGRALPTAYGVLLCGAEDDHITSFFIESAFPTRAEAAAVLSAIGDAPSGLSVPELLTQVNLSQARIQKTIDLLSLESPAPIVKNGSKWQLTVGSLSQSFWDRAERLTQLRIAEKAQMAEYARLRSGHMAYLIRALDGAAPAVEPARLVPLSEHVDPALVQDARAFLRRTDYPIEPRKKWPPRGLPRFGATGNIPEHERARPGRALCVWDDGGWGALVKAGKYTAERFDEALVQAAASLIRSWPRGTTLGWVTCVPSLRRPTLVPNFAQRLAAALGLPFYPVLQQIGDRAEQKLMANSSKQALNLDGTLAVTGTVPPTPVLLVDDVVDSRWTFAVSAWCLIRAGSGQVYPFALALAGGGE